MLRIGLCDDSVEYLQKASAILEKACEDIGREWEIIRFNSELEVLSYFYKGEKVLNLLFLDIDMGKNDSNGIEIATKVNRIAPYCQIAFLTNFIYYATDTYEVDCYYYILKGEFQDRVGQVLKKAFRILENKQDRLIIENHGVEQICNYSDIMWIARNYRTSTIHCVERNVMCSDNISKLSDRLNSLRFVRCHNSFIVNFEYLQQYGRSELILHRGESISISRKYANDVQKQFLKWKEEQLSIWNE